ncbi:MAG: leucine-rich repeat domain-containing protein [Muribaculaceae bacterium]|nr:leucine-rich repeat domain-containing protein [Muribaculaceae bacterium]
MKKILFIISCIMAVFSASALEIVLTPGRLPDMMPSIKDSPDKEWVLKGVATSADLTALRNLPLAVTSLDLSNLEIKGCEQHTGAWFGQTVFSDGEIPAYMLLGTGVKNLRLPATVSVIGKGAFSSTPLTELTVSGVKRMGEGAFHNCTELKKAVFSKSSFTDIPAYTFYGCRELRTISLSPEVEKVGEHAFEKCGIEKIDLSSAKEIGDYAFAHATDLSEIGFAYGCKMGEGAFYGASNLEAVIRHSGNTPPLYSAGGVATDFLNVKGEEVGEGAFSRSKASLVALSENMKHVGPYAFHSMPNLKKIVALCDEIPEADETSFAGNNVGSISLFVKRGEVEKWRQAPVWRDFHITDEDSGINDVATESADVEILRRGDRILISSSGLISEVSLFSLDGMLLSSESPEACSAEVPFPADNDIVIVRVKAGNGIRVVKLK